jgi:Ni/Co efflux regulator RcnB
MGLRTLSLVLAALTVCAPALAEKPAGKGQGQAHGQGHGRKGQNDDEERGNSRAQVNVTFRFGEAERVVVREYFGQTGAGGRCPPGLAKKNNGCLPPGQAKKWGLGQPLPRDVVFYQLPGDLLVRLPAPPPSYRYVRVAGDILMIAVGTGLVIDAIQDLGRL